MTDDSDRMRELEKNIGQLWDLLRQRRSLRDAGQDPDTISLSVLPHAS